MVCARRRTRWLKISTARLRWQGKPAVVLIGTDTTEIKKEQEKLKKANHLLEKIFNSLEDALFLIDPATRRIVKCNPAAEKIFGFAKEEMQGADTRILRVDQAAFERFGADSESALDEGKAYHTVIPTICQWSKAWFPGC